MRTLLLSCLFASCLVASGCGRPRAAPAVGAGPASRLASVTAPIAPAPARTEDPLVVGGSFFASMPRGLTSFGGAVVGDAFYLVGGYGGEPHRYTAEGQSSDVWRLTLGAPGAWSKVASLPHGLQGLAVVAHGDEVCRFGGNRVETAGNGEAAGLDALRTRSALLSVADAACWSTKTGAWRTLPALPKGRSSTDAAMIGSTVYVAGGWQLGDGRSGGAETAGVWHTDVLAMDLASPSPRWSAIEAPVRTRAAAVVALRGKLYLLGGLGADKAPSRAVHVLDPASRTWTRGPDLPSDGFGMAALADERGDRLVATTRDGAILELRAGAWRTLGALAFPRFFHRLAWLGETKLLAIGGITGMQTHGRTRPVEVVSLAPDRAEVARVELPFPGRARNREAVFVEGDFLYLFGGNDSLEQHDFGPDNFVDEGHRLHLPSMSWSAVAPFPRRRQSMQVVAVSGRHLALGGFGHDGAAAVSFEEGFWFDPAKETWSAGPSLPAGRTQFGLTSHRGRVHVFGGLRYDPRRGPGAFDHVTTTLVAPEPGAAAGGFEDLGAPLPGPRRAFGGATLGDEYFVVGGMRHEFELVDDCLRYSFEARRYRSMPCPARTRLSPRLVALEGKLYLVGGSARGASGALEPVRSVEVFDPKTDSWSVALPDIGVEPHHASVAVYRDRIVIASTQSARGTMTLAFLPPAR